MKSIRNGAALLALIAAATVAHGQPAAQPGTAGAASSGPPIRALGPALATTTQPLGAVSQVRALSDGRVLVNDGTRRRLMLFDSTLTLIKIVADSSPLVPNPYGPRALKMMPYYGDSTLLIDGGSLSMLVVDGSGEIVKVRAIPRTEHSTYLSSAAVTYGIPGFDAQGRLVYKINNPIRFITQAAGGGVLIPEQPDSAPILRMNLNTRKIDTAGRVKIQKSFSEPMMMEGYMTTRTLTNPMPVADDWSVMTDGTVAFLRHRDYSVDFLNTDGTWTASPPMPFEWTRLTDDHKKAFVDSLMGAMTASWHNEMARMDSINATCFKTQRTIFPIPVPGAPPAPNPTQLVPLAPPAPGAAPAPPPCPSYPYLPLADWVGYAPKVIPYLALPDYKPPFSSNSMRADADTNLWIRVNQMKPVAGTYLFDIVNRKGQLFDRIQMPIARTLVGFGPGNVVYTTVRSGTPPVLKLEKTRWK